MRASFFICIGLWLGASGFGSLRADDAVFGQNCAPCHSKDGRARTPAARKLGVKDLTLSKISDDEILRQIRDGRKTPDGKLQMPAFGERLSADEITRLIQVVKAFRK